MNLGVTAATFAEARSYYQQSMALCQQIDDQALQGNLLFHLANLEEQLGNHAAAEALAVQSVAHLRAVGDPHNLFIGLINLVAALQGQGYFEQAHHHLREAGAISDSLGAPWNRTVYLLYAGRLALAEGQLDQAEQLLRDALAVAGPVRYVELRQHCMNSLGQVCLERGGHAAARDWFERSLQAMDLQDRKSGSRRLEALVHLGEIALLAGDRDQARARFQAARDQAETIGAEAVWRRLTRHLGLIRFDRHRIVILDPQRLAEEAEV